MKSDACFEIRIYWWQLKLYEGRFVVLISPKVRLAAPRLLFKHILEEYSEHMTLEPPAQYLRIEQEPAPVSFQPGQHSSTVT